MTDTFTAKPRKIYLASSWRNQQQPELVLALRAAGHEVYDFRNPAPGNEGFAWASIDEDWLNWTPEKFAKLLNASPIAANGFAFDKEALEWCDTCILALPCGRSAHLELGYIAGQGKDTYVLLHEDKFEPELMYLLNTACATTIQEIIELMAKRQPIDVVRWHTENGGHFGAPGAHAVRLLREVVELCLASGARVADIQHHVATEINRQVTRPEFNPKGSPEDLPEEWADCQILLNVFAHHACIDKHKAVREKVDVLWGRQWECDADGVLWRPNGKTAQDITHSEIRVPVLTSIDTNKITSGGLHGDL